MVDFLTEDDFACNLFRNQNCIEPDLIRTDTIVMKYLSDTNSVLVLDPDFSDGGVLDTVRKNSDQCSANAALAER